MTTSATATLGRPSDRTIALLLAALGVVLAYVGAVRWNASLDDAYVYALSQHGLGDLLEAWSNDPQSLVSQLILYPFAAAGSPMWWLRIPTVIAFGASVLALWWTARQRYSAAVSLAAAGLLAICPLTVETAASIRWQVFALLLGILGWGALFRAIDSGRRGWWVAYAAILVVGLYTNVILVLLILPQALAVWWARGRALRPWAISLVVAAVLTIPLAVLTLRAGDVNPLFRVSHPDLRRRARLLRPAPGGRRARARTPGPGGRPRRPARRRRLAAAPAAARRERPPGVARRSRGWSSRSPRRS